MAVFIDSCGWNYLFDRQVDLATELPLERFALYVTQEVAIEMDATPDVGKDGKDNSALVAYMQDALDSRVETTATFGFATLNRDGTLAKAQVYGGFGSGTFESRDHREWYGSEAVGKLLHDKPMRPETGLGKNEADASLAVQSFQAVVLTAEGKDSKGPLLLASKQGGRIAYLADFETSGLSLEQFLGRVGL